MQPSHTGCGGCGREKENEEWRKKLGLKYPHASERVNACSTCEVDFATVSVLTHIVGQSLRIRHCFCVDAHSWTVTVHHYCK